MRFEACTEAIDGSCYPHDDMCVDSALRFAVDPVTIFNWDSILTHGDELLLATEKSTAGVDRFHAYVMSGGTRELLIVVEDMSTVQAAEVEAWLDFHYEYANNRAPSISGLLPQESHEECGKSFLSIGSAHNLLGLYVCHGCLWSERGSVTDDGKYAMQQPWPSTGVGLSVSTQPGYPLEFTCRTEDGRWITGKAETLEDAEFKAFTDFLATNDEVGT